MRAGRIDPSVRWAPRSLTDGARVGVTASQVVVEWKGIGRLLASTSGENAEFQPAAGVEPPVLDKFRATSLVACIRYLAGGISLHGSAVRLSSGAVLFVGDKGAGKSTTAMALVERGGGQFLADDVVPIDWQGARPMVLPVNDCFWLTAEASSWFGRESSYPGKKPYSPRERSAAPEPLSGIIELAFDDSVDGLDLQALNGQEAFLVLSKAHICYPTGSDTEAVRDLGSRARLREAAPVFRLRRPRSFDTLEAIERIVAGALAGLR